MPPNVPPQPDATDHSLLRRVHAGEREATEVLYRRYAEKLLSLAQTRIGADLSTRFDPEDILQSVFRTFFRRASRGDYDLPDDESLWNLLLVIGLNKIRAKGALHRAGMRDARRTKLGPVADEAIRAVQTPDEFALIELRLAVEEILGGLPESQRVILELRMDGAAVEDIATETGRAKRTVERAIQEFSRTVRKMIETGG